MGHAIDSGRGQGKEPSPQAAFWWAAALTGIGPARPRRPRPVKPMATAAQPRLFDDVAMPRTRADCRGPGICPVLRCRHHLALWIKPNGAIRIEGAVAKGRTVRGTRSATDEALEAAADMIVELADRLPSLCSLDYADEGRVGPKGLRQILGLKPRRMTKLLSDAAEELDIARARQKRAEARGKEAEYLRRKAVEAVELVQIKRKPKPCK